MVGGAGGGSTRLAKCCDRDTHSELIFRYTSGVGSGACCGVPASYSAVMVMVRGDTSVSA